MTKGRKTTIEERQEIVAHCIEHDYDYKGTAELYGLSYAQVYQWVQKYNEIGYEGLLDKRGKRKKEDQLSNEERLERKIRQLERELELKERENILLKKVKEIKGRRYSPKAKQEVKYLAVLELHHKHGWSIEWMCKVLKIARSSYYKWTPRIETCNEIENHELCNLILDYDEMFKHILCYRRMTDVTEFKIKGSSKKLYLSAIIDLYDLSIVAYHISDRNNNQLVFDTYHKAITRYPEAKPLFHSDRGFQYTSRVFRKQLEDQGIIQSMSRVGHCIDSGPMEGFWGTIKSEMYYPNEFNTRSELKKAIDANIDFYNNKRLQKRFKNKTPMMVRTEALGSETPISYSIPANKKIEAYWSNIREKQMQATVS